MNNFRQLIVIQCIEKIIPDEEAVDEALHAHNS
jgi:ASC-1-like (ASCH) protein